LTATRASNGQIDLAWSASTESDPKAKITYQIQRCKGAGCADAFAQIGTSTSTSYTDKGLTAKTVYTYIVTATDASGNNSGPSNTVSMTTAACDLFPIRPSCVDFGAGQQANINAFYQTNGQLSYFNQVKSIYNGASGAATVSADLATLNFGIGMQVAATTNVQAGSSGTSTVSSGTIPTLSANGAGQATQNMLYGGTFVASELYPFFAYGGSKVGSPGNLGILLDFVTKEGADIQNFKSGANVNVVSPPFHGSAQMEGYLQYNSINLNSSGVFQGAIFVGGSYGYSYTGHGYARDYGFGKRVQNDIGQASVGILINGVAKISMSRAFGPSQTYIDSTSMAQTTVNNFKAWSFGIAYQSAAPASKQ
jgi:chitodextrinase